MLLRLMDSNPWYANIVNFMVLGYVPPGENRKKLQTKSRRQLWDDPYLYRICANGLLRRWVPATEGIQIIENCHAAPYGGHYGHSALNQNLVVRILLANDVGKTPKNSSKGVKNASCKVASCLAMQCPSTTTFE